MVLTACQVSVPFSLPVALTISMAASRVAYMQRFGRWSRSGFFAPYRVDRVGKWQFAGILVILGSRQAAQ